MSAKSSFLEEEQLDYIKLVFVQHHLGKAKFLGVMTIVVTREMLSIVTHH